MNPIDVRLVSRAMQHLLTEGGQDLVYCDRATGERLIATPAAVSSPSGLLLALVVAGEAVWRETTGKGFALDIVPDKEALLGYRLRGIGAGSFTAVMLATMEAAAQVTQPGALLVNDLNAVWAAATDRVAMAARRDARAKPGAAP